MQTTAFIAVITVVIVNSFAAVYMESMLKDASVPFWRTNQYLYMYGMVFQLGTVLFKSVARPTDAGLMGSFNGIGFVAMIGIFMQVSMGLSISTVMKVYDSNVKNAVVACALIFTYICSVILGYAAIRFMFILSAAVVVGAFLMYVTNPYIPPPVTETATDHEV